MSDTITESVTTMLEAAAQARVPVMLVGSPGTGKTATVRALAKRIGYELITLVGSRMDATDIAGLPKGEVVGTDEDGKEIYATVNLSPQWQVDILKLKKVILFLDEFSNTTPSVRAAMLTLLQDREFANGHKFPKETIVIGAMNASAEAADGYEMDLPTNNRLFFISWNPTTPSWVEGMLNAWGREDVPEGEMKWKRLIARFIKENPGWLHRQPEDTATNEVYGLDQNNINDMEVFRSAWASRRSWDNLSRILGGIEGDDDAAKYVQDSIAQGVIGYAASAAFRDWLHVNSNATYKPADVLKDPSIVDWATMSINDANMLLRNIVDGISIKNSEQVIAVFQSIADADMHSIGGPFFLEMMHEVTNSKWESAIRKENLARVRQLAIAFSPVIQDTTK